MKAEAEFNYEGSIIIIQCNPYEKMDEIIKRFTFKVGKKKEELNFIYGGGMINDNLIFFNQANESDKNRNKMSILVNNKIEDNKDDESDSKKSKYIICPECKEKAYIDINNYKFEIYGCKNDHKKDNILINDFEKTQKINESKIICENCNQVNKSTSYNNIFFICFQCKKNLCQLCRSIHDKSHDIIDYDDKFFICDLHYESYFSYCESCKKDICLTCEEEHSNHKTISYGGILPKEKRLKEEMNELYNKKEVLKNDIHEIIKKLKNLINSVDKFYEIYEDIIKIYGNKKRNYSLLQNIEKINKFNIYFIQEINKIMNERNIYNKMNNMIYLYEAMTQIKHKEIEKENKEINIIKIEEK